MPKLSYAAQKKLDVENQALAFFSEGTLSMKIDEAYALTQMSGLNLFVTPVPWNITFRDNGGVSGMSETLERAANDIYANLVARGARLPEDTLVAIDIDKARLPKPFRSQMLRLEGG